jgi:hypothetical protein
MAHLEKNFSQALAPTGFLSRDGTVLILCKGIRMKDERSLALP